MTDKILVPTIADELTDHYLSRRGYQVVTVDNPGPNDILAIAPEVAGIMLISKKLPNDIYEQLPKLKVIARRGVGYDNLDVNYAAQQGIWVTNTPGANAHSVAEMALMDMLMLARNFRQVEFKTRNHDWSGAYQMLGRDLSAATVGIVGFGNVGRELARMLTILGARVLIYGRHPQPTEFGTFVDWETLFREADFVSLHLAATAETDKIVGMHEFELMKRTAQLINLARGTIVDEDALIVALKQQLIGGAALDVFTQEPLVNSPLLGMDNVIVTPHIGANTREANQAMAMTAARMIDAVLSGEIPEFAVNQPVFKNNF